MMKTIKKMILISLLCCVLQACSDSDSDAASAPIGLDPQSLNIRFSSSPIPLQNEARFASDVAYGADPAQRFDLFLPPEGEEAAALVIFIHGGSFTSGDKSTLYRTTDAYGESLYSGSFATQIERYLSQNIAFASINYRLLDTQGNDDLGVKKPLSDVQRALQFIRFHSEDLNIDRERVVLHGVSAGAGAALWLALNDDRAVSQSTGIDAESTRVRAVVAQETQASYDLLDWIGGGVFEPYFRVFGRLFARQIVDVVVTLIPSFDAQIRSFYALDNIANLFSSEIDAYRQDVDMLDFISADDPEIWVSNVEEPEVFPTSPTLFFHHPYHARLLQQRYTQAGLEGVFYVPELDIIAPSQESLSDFVLRKLNP